MRNSGEEVPVRPKFRQRLSNIRKGVGGEGSSHKQRKPSEAVDLPDLSLHLLQPASTGNPKSKVKKGSSALECVRRYNEDNGWNSFRVVRQSLTTEMIDAARGLDFDMVQRIITPVDVNRIIDPANEQGNRLIHCLAVNSSLIQYLQTLFEHNNLEVNAGNASGDTALHIASEANNTAAMECLLRHQNIQCNAKNNVGDSPLHIACREGHLEAFNLLSAHDGVDVNCVNNYGETPLHIACRAQKAKIVKKLVQRDDVLVDIQNNEGDSPLHVAVAQGASRIISILMKLHYPRINLNLKNAYGNTPLHFAAHYYFDHQNKGRYDFSCLGYLLLDLRVDTSTENNEGLRWHKLVTNAMEKAQLDKKLQTLLDHKNEQVRTALEGRNSLRSLPNQEAVAQAQEELYKTWPKNKKKSR